MGDYLMIEVFTRGEVEALVVSLLLQLSEADFFYTVQAAEAEASQLVEEMAKTGKIEIFGEEIVDTEGEVLCS